MKKRATLGSLVMAAPLIAWPLPVVAVDVVIPNINANTPGPSSQGFPFNQGQMRYQQVYAMDQFQGWQGAVTQIAYRVDEAFGGPFMSNPIDTEIRLCHTQRGPNNLSLNFADNLGFDVTLVYDGFLTLSSAGNPNTFDIVINTNEFIHLGEGNLLVEIKVFGPAQTTQFDAAGIGLGEGGTPWTDRLWAFDPNAVSGSSEGDDGYVTQFTLVVHTPVDRSTWGRIKAMYRNQ